MKELKQKIAKLIPDDKALHFVLGELIKDGVILISLIWLNALISSIVALGVVSAIATYIEQTDKKDPDNIFDKIDILFTILPAIITLIIFIIINLTK